MGRRNARWFLEFVEGPTLAGYIAQGPIPIDELLPHAVADTGSDLLGSSGHTFGRSVSFIVPAATDRVPDCAARSAAALEGNLKFTSSRGVARTNTAAQAGFGAAALRR